MQKMFRLKRLMVSHNQIESISGEELVASLKILDLSHNSLRVLAPTFWENLGRRCFQLEQIHLSHNQLSEKKTRKHIPRVLVQLKHLVTVDLSAQSEATHEEQNNDDDDIANKPESPTGKPKALESVEIVENQQVLVPGKTNAREPLEIIHIEDSDDEDTDDDDDDSDDDEFLEVDV